MINFSEIFQNFCHTIKKTPLLSYINVEIIDNINFNVILVSKELRELQSKR